MIKHWFMKHFYSDMYQMYRELDNQKQINEYLVEEYVKLEDRVDKLERKLNDDMK